MDKKNKGTVIDNWDYGEEDVDPKDFDYFPDYAIYYGRRIKPASTSNIIVYDEINVFESNDKYDDCYKYWKKVAMKGFDKEKWKYDDWALAYKFRYEQAALDAGVEQFCDGVDRGVAKYFLKVPKSLARVLHELEAAEFATKKLRCVVIKVPYRLKESSDSYCFDGVMCEVVKNLVENIEGFDVKKQGARYDFYYGPLWSEDYEDNDEDEELSLIYPLMYSCENIEEIVELSKTIRDVGDAYVGSFGDGKETVAFSKTEKELGCNFYGGGALSDSNGKHWLKRLQ